MKLRHSLFFLTVNTGEINRLVRYGKN